MVRQGTVIRAVLLLILIAIMFPSFNSPQPVKAVTPYPPPGSKVWAVSEHVSPSSDTAHGVAVDGSGAYVVGTDQATAEEWRIERRNLASGTIAWAVSEHVSTSWDEAYGVAVDGSGVYVVGNDRKTANGYAEWRVEKRSPATGALIWGQSEDISSGKYDDWATSVAVDGSGVYVAGTDNSTASRWYEWRIEKRSLTTGAIIWAQSEHISSSNDYAQRIAVDSSGVYVAGYDRAPGHFEWRIEKRSLTTGSIVWAQSEDINGMFSYAFGVAVDASGLYMVGYDTSPGYWEWRVEKRSLTTGSIIWAQSEDISSNGAGAFDVAVDTSGVYVAGRDYSTGNSEWRVEKRSLTDGSIIWAQSEDLSNGNDAANAVAVDGSGVFVVGWDHNPGQYEWRVERRSKPNGDPVSATGTGRVFFTVSNGSVGGLAPLSPTTISPLPPAGLTFPHGLFDLRVTNLTTGASVNVTMVLPSPLPLGPSFMYWKLHAGAWVQLPSDQLSVSANRTVVVLKLTDGAVPDDDDGSANGVIVDPGGIAYAYSLSLVAGWNLVSLPVVPVDPTATNMLRSLAASGKLGLVWGYAGTPRGWKFYLPGKVSTLTAMNDGYGYEVYMRSPDTLYVNGSAIPFGSTPPSYPLVAGWNLVGFKSQPNATESKTVGAYLASIDGAYDHASVWVYSNAVGVWIRADTDPGMGTVLRPGDGMWVLMTTPATLKP